MRRCFGVTVPLFSLRSGAGWGIGEVPDLVRAAAWVKRGGASLLQILPVHALPMGETSPYGAMTAFALDPIFLRLEDVEDFRSHRDAFVAKHAATIEALERRPLVDFRGVRSLKEEALTLAAGTARRELEEGDSDRARSYTAFVERSADWLEPYARYVVARSLYERKAPSVGEVAEPWSWRSWNPGARDASFPPYRAEGDLFFRIRYEQWLLEAAWTDARKALSSMGVRLMGDLPFVVGRESADVFARPDLFRGDVSLGAPPDAFSADGQDWGLPPYDWAAMDGDALAWFQRRARRERDLFDSLRIDHLVGLYRQYVRRPKELGVFDPPNEPDQLARGEKMLTTFRDAAAPLEVIAEDLGVIPDFVRESMARLALPGYRVLPWERDGMYYRHPSTFPRDSVATWSTHDTAPITAWWNEFTDEERRSVASCMGIAPDLSGVPLFEAQMRHLFSAGSSLALALAQEVIGETARINTPGTISDENWSYRLPKTLDELDADPSIRARLSFLLSLAESTDRL